MPDNHFSDNNYDLIDFATEIKLKGSSRAQDGILYLEKHPLERTSDLGYLIDNTYYGYNNALVGLEKYQLLDFMMTRRLTEAVMIKVNFPSVNIHAGKVTHFSLHEKNPDISIFHTRNHLNEKESVGIGDVHLLPMPHDEFIKEKREEDWGAYEKILMYLFRRSFANIHCMVYPDFSDPQTVEKLLPQLEIVKGRLELRS